MCVRESVKEAEIQRRKKLYEEERESEGIIICAGHFALNEGVQIAFTGCLAESSLMFIPSVCTSKHCLQPLLLHSQLMISQLFVKDFPHLSTEICAAINSILIKKKKHLYLASFRHYTIFHC